MGRKVICVVCPVGFLDFLAVMYDLQSLKVDNTRSAQRIGSREMSAVRWQPLEQRRSGGEIRKVSYIRVT